MSAMNVISFTQARAILKQTPALSVGICIFTVIFYILYPKDSKSLILYPTSPVDLNLNAISFYIFPHVNIIHMIINLVSLFPFLSKFEKAHGTIFTGVILNLLAVFTALMYCLPGYFIYPNDGVAGLLGIVFSFLTYTCLKECRTTPTLSFNLVGRNVSIPTEVLPFLNLFIVAILVPSASFFGHLAGIGAGFLMAYNCFNVLYPSPKLLAAIEGFCKPGIAKLKEIVDFVLETDIENERGLNFTPFFAQDSSLRALESQNFTTTGERHAT